MDFRERPAINEGASGPIRITTEGLRYAAKVSVGTAFLWWALRLLGDANPLWAVISFIIVAEPMPAVTLQNVRQRLINTVVGGAVGLASLLVLGTGDWTLPIATS